MIEDDDYQPPSRSARKREAEALQKLGEQLVDLAPAQLREIPLSTELLEAIQLAQRIREFSGRRRQLQLIGRLMRKQDPEPIQAALERLNQRSASAIAEHHQAERWRERLLAEGNSALTEFLEQYPTDEQQQLRQLIRTAQQEQAAERPPRATRELFRLLRKILSGAKS